MNEHFRKLFKRFNNRLLFTVGKTQNAKIMYKVLNRLDFSNLLNARSKAKLAKNKSRKTANIIGNNHKLLEKCQNKLYLLVLTFIHYFAMISQENILWVGCNKLLIDHLSQINACNTYYVKTNGMTLRDCKYIEEASFSNENDIQKQNENKKEKDRQKMKRKGKGRQKVKVPQKGKK